MSSVLQNIIIFVGLIGISALGYFLYTQNEQANLNSTDNQISNNIAIEASDFLRKLNELTAITLNTDIFQDPRFTSLVDFSTPVNTESIGRTNPFLNN